jgi:putative selenate reductase molybdopterin-binding subunit
MSEKKTLSFIVNGRPEVVDVSPRARLLDVLRIELGLTGTKEGCGTGDCGTCTVLLDGKAVNSCLVLALQAQGCEVTTIEGLGRPGRLDPIQEALVETGAVQCGFCTPGMVLTIKALLDKNPSPTEEEIRGAISSNLCRCTGYKKILEAVPNVISGRTTENATGQTNESIGVSMKRRDAVEKVTGRAIYAEDIQLPKMIYGAVVRSPYAHARILSIDTSDAEKMPGVEAVVTGRDLEMGYYGIDLQDQQVFALEKARFVGEPVAAVAAATREQARAAAERVKVEYEVMPGIFDPIEAVSPEAPLVHDDVNRYEHKWDAERGGNLCYQTWMGHGDVEKGFSESDVVVEGTYTTPVAHPGPLEPHSSTADVDPSGRLTVWTTSQKPFAVRAYLARGLKRPVSDFKIVPTHIGGGFGGKLVLCLEPYAVLLAEKSGRPVQMTLTREEEMATTTLRHPVRVEIKTGAMKDGTLVAQKVKAVFDTGAYSGDGPTAVALAALMSTGPYRFRHVDITGKVAYTNNTPCGSCRCPSGPQMAFAVETHLEKVARALDIESLELRLNNAWEEGDRTATGQVLTSVSIKECLEKAAESIGWREPKDKNTGRGLACNWWVSGTWATSTLIETNEDGTFRLISGGVDMGTGSLYSSFVQMAAAGLGVPTDAIQLVRGDTDTLPWDHGHGGSRMVFTLGWSAYEAARDLKEQLLEEASTRLDTPIDRLRLESDRVFVHDEPDRFIGLSHLCYSRHKDRGGPLIGRSTLLPQPPASVERQHSRHPYPAFPAPSFCAHAAELTVDDQTGEVTVKRYSAVHDVGKAINPAGCEGQIEGGVAMGLGLALTEEFRSKNGKILNPSFADYLLLTAEDMPPVEAVLVEKPAVEGPFGAKGLGEPPIAPPTGAIANALIDLLGVDPNELPLTPERVLALIDSRQK